MLSEVLRLRQLLERTYQGDAWHGPSVQAVLSDLSVSQALCRLGGSHNSAELVRHMTAWRRFVILRLEEATTYELSDEVNWTTVNHLDESTWQQTRRELEQSQNDLLSSLESMKQERLSQPVAHRSYDYYTLLHGIIQHDIYHLGQIRLLSSYA